MTSAEDEIAAGERALGALDYEGAHRHFEKATRLDPKNPIAYFGKAESALGVPNVDSAEIGAAYKKAIELDPENPQFLEAFASYSMDQGRFNEAEQAYLGAAKLDADNAAYYYSEFAVQYRSRAPIVMEQFLDDKTRDIIAKKALEYMLKALAMTRDEARRLLA